MVELRIAGRISSQVPTVAFQEFETLLGTELFILPAISSSTIHILSMSVSVLLTSRR